MRLAAIIPTLNEAAAAPRLGHRLLESGFDQVVVADGGSGDGTPDLACAAGAIVTRSDPGRGVQLAAGAGAADADAFLFIHADSVPPHGAAALICNALADPAVAAGAFRLAFDADHPLLRLYAAASRVNATPFTYGDQGLFVRRDVYEAIGGYAPWPLLEDLEIQHRLRRAGRFVKLPAPITTSARRFVRDGVLRRQLRNAGIVARFYGGWSPARLAREYAPHRP